MVVSVKDRLRMFEKARNESKTEETEQRENPPATASGSSVVHIPQSPSSIKRRESGRVFRAATPSPANTRLESRQPESSPTWKNRGATSVVEGSSPGALASPSRSSIVDGQVPARYSSPFLPASTDGQQQPSPVAQRSPRQSFPSPSRGNRTVSPPAVRKASPSRRNTTPSPSGTIPPSSDQISSSPQQQRLSTAHGRSSFGQNRQQLEQQQKNPMAVKSRISDLSWLTKDNSSGDEDNTAGTVPPPKLSSGRGSIGKISSPFLSQQTSMGSSTQKSWRPSPRGGNKSVESDGQGAFRNSRKSEPSYVASKGSPHWPLSLHDDSNERRQDSSSRDNDFPEERQEPEPSQLMVTDGSSAISGSVSTSTEGKREISNETNQTRASKPSRFTTSPKKTEPRSSWGTAAKLESSLNAAKDVMEEERSNAGSSDASNRSSLSITELSDIASRALRISSRSERKNLASKPVFLPPPKSMKMTSAASSSSSDAKIDSGSSSESLASREPRQGTKFSRAALLSHALKRAAAHESVRSQERTRVQSRENQKVSEVSTTAEEQSVKSMNSGDKSKADSSAKSNQSSGWSKASNHAARRALLSAAQKHKNRKSDKFSKTDCLDGKTAESVASSALTATVSHQQPKKETTEVAARIGFKASKVLAMKNSSKAMNTSTGGQVSPPPFEDYDIQTAGSTISGLTTDSMRSRRTSHPAFIARASSPRPGAITPQQKPESGNIARKDVRDGDNKADIGMSNPNVTQKPFSEELFSSFRNFNATRKSESDCRGMSI